MATYNGDDDNLLFRCGECQKEETIEIDLSNKADKDRLWKWLQKHSASGGDYINVPIDLEKIPVAKRTEEQHQKLIEKYGGVRAYLISMGPFKDVPITDED